MPEIRNFQKAADRILKAVKNKEKIIIYGDADLDGTTSVIIMKEAIKDLGGNIVSLYFPDRETEGYGITETGLKLLKKNAPALLIALDCGIGNVKEVKIAKKMGFDIVIIDHHEELEELPDAEIIVDPKQKKDKYPFKDFAAVGLAYKLSHLLLKEKMTDNIRRNFLELTALATLADMMPQEDENKLFIDEGLCYLKTSWRPGIRVFWETDTLKQLPTFNQKVFKMISVLNVRDVENNFPASFRLLTATSVKEAEELISKLLSKAEDRKEKINEIVEQIEEEILKEEEPIVFKGSSAWDYTFLSTIASIICNRHKIPTFIYKKLKKEAQGTVRAPKGVDSVALMKKCSKHVLTYGGHAPASGFRLENKNIEKFKECLIKNYKP